MGEASAESVELLSMVSGEGGMDGSVGSGEDSVAVPSGTSVGVGANSVAKENARDPISTAWERNPGPSVEVAGGTPAGAGVTSGCSEDVKEPVEIA